MDRDCSLKVDGIILKQALFYSCTRWDEQPPNTYAIRYTSCFDALTDFQFSNTINSAEQYNQRINSAKTYDNRIHEE